MIFTGSSYKISILQAVELQRWKLEEERRLEEAHLAEEAAMAIVEKERAKSRAAIEAAEAAKRIAELEAQKRINAEMKALKESEEKRKALNALQHSDVRYRKYTIDEIEAATEFFAESRKIGEGGYGPVYRCYLDHTPVAIKVLRPDAAQGRSQFNQEVLMLPGYEFGLFVRKDLGLPDCLNKRDFPHIYAPIFNDKYIFLYLVQLWNIVVSFVDLLMTMNRLKY